MEIDANNERMPLEGRKLARRGRRVRVQRTFCNETLKRRESYMTVSNPHIEKQIVIAWAIIKVNRSCDEHNWAEVYGRPICQDSTGFGNFAQVWEDEEGEDEKLVTVMPAAPGTYTVSATFTDGYDVELGLEIPGVSHPDWETEAWKRLEMERKIEAQSTLVEKTTKVN